MYCITYLSFKNTMFKKENKESKMTKPYYCVIDFEANCTSQGKRDHEIIEFPAILINTANGETISEFRRFVHTIKTGKISRFINELTHITDADLHGELGCTWWECLSLFEEWCKENNITSENTTIVTCGDWDFKTMLPRQLELTKTKLSALLTPLLSSWHNVKRSYKTAKNVRRAPGMGGMLTELKIPLVGHHHSGIDDSRNIAKICIALNQKGEDTSQCNRFQEKGFWYTKGQELPFRRTKNGKIVVNDKYQYYN